MLPLSGRPITLLIAVELDGQHPIEGLKVAGVAGKQFATAELGACSDGSYGLSKDIAFGL